MTQQSPSDQQSRDGEKQPPRAALVRTIERIAGEINPVLMIFALGLGILDVTCYLGIQASRQQAMNAPVAAAATHNR